MATDAESARFKYGPSGAIMDGADRLAFLAARTGRLPAVHRRDGIATATAVACLAVLPIGRGSIEWGASCVKAATRLFPATSWRDRSDLPQRVGPARDAGYRSGTGCLKVTVLTTGGRA